MSTIPRHSASSPATAGRVSVATVLAGNLAVQTRIAERVRRADTNPDRAVLVRAWLGERTDTQLIPRVAVAR